MSKIWYGSLENRLEEGKQFCESIEVGTGITEYFYSDRQPYEVTEVKDQKHIKIRRLDHEAAGTPMSNTWKLISNPKHPEIELVKRGNVWYKVKTATIEDVKRAEKDIEKDLYLCMNGFDKEKIKQNGKQTKYSKMNISIGKAEYYYDYSF